MSAICLRISLTLISSVNPAYDYRMELNIVDIFIADLNVVYLAHEEIRELQNFNVTWPTISASATLCKLVKMVGNRSVSLIASKPSK